jgi:hypothetical protein
MAKSCHGTMAWLDGNLYVRQLMLERLDQARYDDSMEIGICC